MNITIERNALAGLLSRALGVVAEKSPQPILGCVHLHAENGRVHVRATDLVIGSVESVACEVGKPGSVAVNARALADRVSALPEGPFSAIGSSGKLTLSSGKRKHVLTASGGNDFPEVASAKETEIAKIDAPALGNAIAFCSGAMSLDVGRPNMNGLAFEIANGVLTVVGVDGYRFHKTEVPAPSSKEWGGVVPLRAVKALAKLCSSSESVEMWLQKRALVFVAGDTTLVAQLTDAAPVPWRQVVPSTADMPKYPIKRADAMAAIRAVSASADAKLPCITLVGKNDEWSVSAASKESQAESEDAIPSEGAKGHVSFDPNFVLAALGVLGADVTMHLSSENNPIIFTDSSVERFTLVMPRRL